MKPEPKLIVNLTRGSVVVERTVIADRPLRRMRGLLGRASLPPGEGMLLRPAPSIHTAFMRFPIDVVFMDGTFGVLKIVARLAPWRTAFAPRARAVLELAAGESLRRGIELGDQLGVLDVNDGAADEAGTAVNGGAEHGVVVRAEDGVGGTRVLIAAKDRRFRVVAGALLARRGYEVTFTERTANMAEIAKRVRAEVVVLDAGDSLTAAAREAAQLETLAPAVGLVVVSEQYEDGLSAMPVVAKWGSFDELFRMIEDACPTRASQRFSNAER
jgi:uncharacterized protein